MLLTFDIVSLRIFHRYFSSNYLYLLNTNFSDINVSIVLSKSNCSFVAVTLMLLSINNSTGIDRKIGLCFRDIWEFRGGLIIFGSSVHYLLLPIIQNVCSVQLYESVALLKSSLKLENVDCVPKFSSYDKILVLMAKTRL